MILLQGTATGAGTDTLVGIEILTWFWWSCYKGNAYANSFIGGAGNDTLSYANSSNAVTINFTAGTASGDGQIHLVKLRTLLELQKQIHLLKMV